MPKEQKPDEIETAEEVLEFYREKQRPLPQEDIVQILKDIQEVNGCVSPAVQSKVAENAGVGLSMVSCLVKMYPSLRAGVISHTVTVCTGGRCSRKTAEIVQELKKEFGFDKKGVSADGKVALRTRHCLKNCRTAPNVLIDGKLCKNATVQKILEATGRGNNKIE